MKPLFKYLPNHYAQAYLDGEILFRPLTYFILLDSDNRADIHEGSHVDWPANDVRLDVYEPDGKTFRNTIIGDFAMRRSLKFPHKVFIHCVSKTLSPDLFKKFRADTCIEIAAPREFADRLKTAIPRQIKNLKPKSVQFESVEYYDIKRARTMRNIEIPLNIPFFKPDSYQDEEEFRFMFARFKGLETEMKLTNAAYVRSRDEKLRQTSRLKHVRIGSIRDFCHIHTI